MIQKIHLIVNPRGWVGDNVQISSTATSFLEDHGIKRETRLTERAGHAPEIVKQLEFGEEEAVCGIGGDITMHELVNGMMNHTLEMRFPLALLPGETGNSFL